MRKFLFRVPVTDVSPSLGLLLHRLVFGGFMVFGHGLPKLLSFNAKAPQFADPLGMGPELSMAAAVFSEVFCGLCVMAGLATRLAVLPLMFTMLVAAFVVHGGDPFFLPASGAKEPALLYLSAFVLLLITGPGRYALDRLVDRQ
ncbi:MAG: DoxX family membrane protein [Caldithrix sp.]|nr:DoxX family membrane protein [Caldithrix sp.]